jgi:transposase-like protein
MQGNFQNLSEKQELALAALLAGKTRKQAARLATVNEVTIYRWLNDDFFRSQLRGRRGKLFDEAAGQLYGLTEKAIATLKKNLDCGIPSVEVKAALGIISQALSTRNDEILARLERMEKLLEDENYAEFGTVN